METILGIDFGTSNSVVSVMEKDSTIIIPNDNGSLISPSIISYSKGTLKAGTLAGDTIRDIKSHLGSDDKILVGDTTYTPVELSAVILQKLKANAESYLGHEVHKAVMTVPAYFNEIQRQAVRDAGTIAGLEVVRIINEPTAAALSYKMNYVEEEQKILVYDFGGGTLDVSVLVVTDGIFEVLSSKGRNDLGGRNFQEVIVDRMLGQFQEQTGMYVHADKDIMERFFLEAERIKKDLSTTKSVDISIPYVTPTESLYFTLERSEFEELSNHLVQQSEALLIEAIESAGIEASELDRVLLVGGTTRIPFIQESVKKITGKTPYKKINPDEAVARGAALQAGILNGDIRDLVLVDITPMAFGVETVDGGYSTIIKKGSQIPCSRKKIFKTVVDRQEAIDIMIYQGDRQLSKYNNFVGKVTLDKLVPAPAGAIRIEVVFSIDANGILKVAARDTMTGKVASQKFESPSLSNEDITRMTKLAKIRKERDEKELEQNQILYNGEEAILNGKRVLSLHHDKVEESLLTSLEKSVYNLEKAITSLDVEFIPHYIQSVEICTLAATTNIEE